MPGAHDALTARMIEAAGFAAYGVGGAALSATQLALPDAGLQSFGEYRDAVSRIMEGSRLPVMIDGENGFGDVKAVTRTVRSFERMGVSGIAFEDLVFPPALGARPTVIPRAEMRGKLQAALAARVDERLFIIARTDAAYAADTDEALARAREFERLGVDAVLATGLAELDAYRRLRDVVSVPIIAVLVPGTPWFAPTLQQLTEVGIEAALYPAAILTRIMQAIGSGLDAIRNADGAPAAGFDMRNLAAPLRTDEWAAIDHRFGRSRDGT
jgi:2-methylisocitrate lyase-like PEP mutase family enzyme